MTAERLAGLEPAAVFAYFEKLCSIPHGSRNTKLISDYLVSFAQEQGLRYIQDGSNNVIIFQKGTCGLEDRPPVIIQGHMDMVCEKDADCLIDMDREGLDVTHDDECVFARGTTLGGDDGIAVAYALALLADRSIPHPPLNIDSEDEGVFTVSCAGGATATICLPVTRRPVYGPCVKLVVEGLKGGHSGVEIHQNRANANKVMGEFLSRVQKLMPLCITSISGGSKDNAIPRSCQVNLVALGMGLERINDVAAELEKQIREEYDEPEARVYGDDVDAFGGNAIPTELTDKVIALLCACPNGVQKMSEQIQGLVQTSLNLGIVNSGEEVKLVFSVRSSVNEEKKALLARLEELARFHDAVYTQMGEYPAWEYRENSPLRDASVAAYEKLFGQTPEVVAIHAGLECGLLSEKLPGLDCISFGPQMHDIHTSREKLEIASVKRTWDFLLEVLKTI